MDGEPEIRGGREASEQVGERDSQDDPTGGVPDGEVFDKSQEVPDNDTGKVYAWKQKPEKEREGDGRTKKNKTKKEKMSGEGRAAIPKRPRENKGFSVTGVKAQRVYTRMESRVGR